jgi:uncharacterized protein YciW
MCAMPYVHLNIMYIRALRTEISVYAYNKAVPLSTLTVAQLVKELLAFYYNIHTRPSKKGSRGNIKKKKNFKEQTNAVIKDITAHVASQLYSKPVRFCALKSVLKQR